MDVSGNIRTSYDNDVQEYAAKPRDKFIVECLKIGNIGHLMTEKEIGNISMGIVSNLGFGA